MAITISGNGITSANIADGTITTDDINASDVTSLKSGRKNLIINGGMQVAQRGTSAASTGWGQQAYRTVDRWQTQFNASGTTGTATQEQITDQSTTIGHPYYTRFTVDTAQATVGSTDRFTLKQIIENNVFNHLNWGTSAAKDLTLSFWVRSNITGIFSTTFRWHDSAGTASSYTSEYTISTANTWEYKTISIPAPSLSTTAYSEFNVEAAQLRFSLMTGSTQAGAVDAWQTPANTWGSSNQTNLFTTSGNTFDITGVQLELGSVATDFEHRSYGEELALCQRYYVQYKGNGVNIQSMIGTGGQISTTRSYVCLALPVAMRVTPTLSHDSNLIVSNSRSFDATVSSVGLYGTDTKSLYCDIAHSSGGGVDLSINFRPRNGTTGYLALDAEL